MSWIISIALFIWVLFAERENKALKSRCNDLKKDNETINKAATNLIGQKEKEIASERKVAFAFEQSVKTMEEHLAAERSRADRLEAALLKMKEENQQASKLDGLSTEWANIFAYNGTGDGQEDV